MYNPKSKIATEFIDDGEIKDTLRYADENRDNLELIARLIEKAGECKGLTHREAAVLLACEDEEMLSRIFRLAEQIKQEFYGNRIVLFAPLYLSNYCMNGCVYCPYQLQNKTIPRKKLTQEEIAAEVIALQDQGHKRLRSSWAKTRSTIRSSTCSRAFRPSTRSSTRTARSVART